MKSVARIVLSLFVVAIIALPLAAAQKEKKERKGPRQQEPAAVILKKLEKAELTEAQVAAVKKLAAATAEKTKEARAKAELTEAQKAAMKKAREEGKKGEDLEKAVTLTEAQQAAKKVIREAEGAMMKQVMGLLTPEQIEKSGIKARGERGGEKRGEKSGEKKPRAKKNS